MTSFVLEGFYNLEWYYSDMWSRDGWRHQFMVVTWILVWFFSVLVEIFVLVWFCLSWCHFTPQEVVRSTESWYDFSSPWLIFRLSLILFDLVLFHILVRSTASWYDFFSFGRQFRLGVILSDLVSFRILVRITKSWCDLCVLGGDIFLYISFYSCMYIFIFTHVFKTSCTQIKFLV